MNKLSVRLSPATLAKLSTLAGRRGSTKTALVHEAIQRLFEEEGARKRWSVRELMHDLQGVGAGPSDLATNRTHMRNFGK